MDDDVDRKRYHKRAVTRQKKAVEFLFDLHRNTLLELDKRRQRIRNE